MLDDSVNDIDFIEEELATDEEITSTFTEDSFKTYFREISRYKILNRDETIDYLIHFI